MTQQTLEERFKERFPHDIYESINDIVHINDKVLAFFTSELQELVEGIEKEEKVELELLRLDRTYNQTTLSIAHKNMALGLRIAKQLIKEKIYGNK